MASLTPNEKDDNKATILNYLSEINIFTTVTQKMNKLCELSSLRPYDISDRNYICENIWKRLQLYYPDCKVLIYGSTGNGFGTIGCDLDLLFLPSSDYCKLGNEQEEESTVPTVYDVKKGEFPKTQLIKMSEKAQLCFVRKVLRHSRYPTQHLLFIPAKCPILKFTGAGKQQRHLSCDLSCRNSLVLHNTRLLNFFGKIDRRVKPLVMTLRFWGKCLGFIKTGALSSYAFTLLVLFFLQRVNPPVLPSVDFLMEVSGFSYAVAEWEVGFTTDLNEVPKSRNENTEGELLQSFFTYFWNFDFTRNIVSIRTGDVLPVKELKYITDERITSFEVSAMCIQDPFDLSHNVSKNVKHNGLPDFKLSLLIASRMLLNKTDCVTNNDVFRLLFDDDAYKKEIENDFSLQVSEFSKSFHINLDHEIITSLSDDENLYRTWYTKTCMAVLALLQDALFMECEVIDKSPFIQEVFLQDDLLEKEFNDHFYSKRECLLTIQCAVYNRVWCNRKATTVVPDFDSDAMELSHNVLKTEHMISKSIISSNPLFSSPEPVSWFLCECYKSEFSQLPHLMIVLTPLTKSKEFKQACQFLSSFIPRNVARMLIA